MDLKQIIEKADFDKLTVDQRVKVQELINELKVGVEFEAGRFSLRYYSSTDRKNISSKCIARYSRCSRLISKSGCDLLKG